jgi:hypothetical protein
MRIAAMLLVGVFVANYTWRWIAVGTRFTEWATWYMLQGLWIALLCCILASLLYEKPKCITRNVAIGACVIGGVEGAQHALFRFLIDDPKTIPRGVDLADHVTGLPISTTLLTMYTLIISAAIFPDVYKQIWTKICRLPMLTR